MIDCFIIKDVNIFILQQYIIFLQGRSISNAKNKHNYFH